MRNNKMIFALVAGGLALASTNVTAQATEEGLPPTRQPQFGQLGQYSKPAEPAHSSAAASNLKASTIIGLPVRNDSGEALGKVQDLVVNLQTHSTPFAIVEYGGTLGIGQTRVAVPLTDFKWSSAPRELIVTATKAQFDTASSTPTGRWMAFASEDWTKTVDRFYGQPSAATASRYERQETSGMGEGREPVRNAAEQKGASQLLDQPPAISPGAENMLAKPADEDVATKVNGLIRQNVGDKADAIQVTIAQGVVTLSGKVASDAQKKVIETQIKALPGVDRVENKLVTGNE
jgi:sporulation protein YlmC with PRC-barrel domain